MDRNNLIHLVTVNRSRLDKGHSPQKQRASDQNGHTKRKRNTSPRRIITIHDKIRFVVVVDRRQVIRYTSTNHDVGGGGSSRKISSARSLSASVNTEGIVRDRVAAASSSPCTVMVGLDRDPERGRTSGAEATARPSGSNRTLGRRVTSSGLVVNKGDVTSSPLPKNRAERVPLLLCVGDSPFGGDEESLVDREMGLSSVCGSPDIGAADASTATLLGFSFSETSGKFECVRCGERECSTLRPMNIWNHVGRGPGESELLRRDAVTCASWLWLWRLFALVETERRLRVALAFDNAVARLRARMIVPIVPPVMRKESRPGSSVRAMIARFSSTRSTSESVSGEGPASMSLFDVDCVVVGVGSCNCSCSDVRERTC